MKPTGDNLQPKLWVITSNPTAAVGFRVYKPSPVSKHLAAATAICSLLARSLGLDHSSSMVIKDRERRKNKEEDWMCFFVIW